MLSSYIIELFLSVEWDLNPRHTFVSSVSDWSLKPLGYLPLFADLVGYDPTYFTLTECCLPLSFKSFFAGQIGFEPIIYRLTADCFTIKLLTRILIKKPSDFLSEGFNVFV